MAAPSLAARIRKGEPIREVVYQDRYVRSPFVARLVSEILSEVIAMGGGVMSGTRLRIVTTAPDRPGRSRRWVQDDWASGQEAKKAIERLFYVRSMSINLTLRDIKRAPHERECRIVWESGGMWRCHLDHGLGFLRAGEQVLHPFSRSTDRQGSALAKVDFDIAVKRPGVVYVFGVE